MNPICARSSAISACSGTTPTPGPCRPGGAEPETARSAPRLCPTGRFEKDYAHGGEEYVGLHVPIAFSGDGPADKARAFRAAAAVLTEEFGDAPIMGVYGDPGPFYNPPPLWGSPFLRWRDQDNSLELHAGEHGPELLLQPTGPVENWFWRQGHGENYALGGFFGTRRDPANAGLGIPGGRRTEDWDVFTITLGNFLRTLPAETHALGIELGLGIHARVPGTHGPILFLLSCRDRLEIAYDTEPLGELDENVPDPLTFGWTPYPSGAAVVDNWFDATHHSGSFGIGEVDGRALATMLVDTLRALGVSSPKDLGLADHSQRVGDYYVHYYGLTLRENP